MFAKNLMTTFSVCAGFPVNTELQNSDNIKINQILILFDLTLKDDSMGHCTRYCEELGDQSKTVFAYCYCLYLAVTNHILLSQGSIPHRAFHSLFFIKFLKYKTQS